MVKKILIAASFASLSFFGMAQINFYQKVKNLINITHPEINTENRLIAFNVWSVDDSESREANQSFEKAYSVYEYARLKGGSKGIIVVSFNKDNLSSSAVISYNKDGIFKIIPFKVTDLEGLNEGTSNLVFDSGGNEIYKNLSAQNIFSSIQHLITR